MCGIVGIFARHGTASIDAAHRAIRALSHRGPDGHGAWHSASGNLILGHTRLSIVDLSTGQQPIASEDGSVQVVVNGEFYDFERIQRELVARGHVLRTGSDSEILIHLYEDR